MVESFKDLWEVRDIALLLDRRKRDEPILKIIVKSLPEVKWYVEIGIDPEEVDCLERNMVCKSVRGMKLDGMTNMFILPYTEKYNLEENIDSKNEESGKEEEPDEGPKGPINLVALGRTNIKYIRKCAEYVF